MKLICWIKEYLRSVTSLQAWQGGFPISGHAYVDIEEHENCKVTISKCEICGKINILWSNSETVEL